MGHALGVPTARAVSTSLCCTATDTNFRVGRDLAIVLPSSVQMHPPTVTLGLDPAPPSCKVAQVLTTIGLAKLFAPRSG